MKTSNTLNFQGLAIHEASRSYLFLCVKPPTRTSLDIVGRFALQTKKRGTCHLMVKTRRLFVLHSEGNWFYTYYWYLLVASALLGLVASHFSWSNHAQLPLGKMVPSKHAAFADFIGAAWCGAWKSLGKLWFAWPAVHTVLLETLRDPPRKWRLQIV